MRSVVQRVREARVKVEGQLIAEIGAGLVILLGVGTDDTDSDTQYIADKVAHLRIFEDDQGKMNLSALDLNKEILVVSQFTLLGDSRRGRRPSFGGAAEPAIAEAYYQQVVRELKGLGLKVETGQFQAEMLVEIFNDGPVTLLIDSRRQF